MIIDHAVDISVAAGEEAGPRRQHSELTTKALRKRTPSAASRSMLGVWIQGKRASSPCDCCTTLMASQRWSSVYTKRKFGRVSALALPEIANSAYKTEENS